MWTPIAVVSLILLFATAAAVFIFARIWTHASRTRELVRNLSLSLCSLVFLWIILDIMFGVCMVQSDNYGFTLASQRWFQKYWHPINSDGYRDDEHIWKSNILFVVGDSFMAGHGIKQIDNRVAGVLAKKLGNDWTVAVLAKNGWSLSHEFLALMRHQKRPQKILLSYYLNDIESAAMAGGFRQPQLTHVPNAVIRPLVNHSFVLNWLYWRFYRRGGWGEIYWRYLAEAYRNPAIWDLHVQEIWNIVGFANQIHADIAVLVWPNLTDIDGSVEHTSRVVQLLREHGVAVLDLATHFQKRTSATLVVNAIDGHPNEQTHHEVAELAYPLLFRQE